MRMKKWRQLFKHTTFVFPSKAHLPLNLFALQTRRRILCIAILTFWAGVDNIISGVVEYADAGVGVFAGAISIGTGLFFLAIASMSWIKRQAWQYNHNCVRWFGFSLCAAFMCTVCVNAVSRYHCDKEHNTVESTYLGYHAAGMITIAILVLSHTCAPVYMFCLPYVYAIVICSSPWASSIWLTRFCVSHMILFSVLGVIMLKDQREAFEDKVSLRQAELMTEKMHKDEQNATHNAAEETQQRICECKARERTYTSLLKMISHDFKGTVLNLQSQSSQLEGQEILIAELHHILHSITSIKYRYAVEPLAPCAGSAPDSGQRQEADTTRLTDLMATMALLFRGATFSTLDLEVAIKPCLLHLAVHQLLCNSRVHGGGQITCTVTAEGDNAVISVLNLPGPHHQKLMAAGDDALKLALSRAVGVASSSGLGLQDIFHIMLISNCKFSIKWKAGGVEARVMVPIRKRAALTCTKPDGNATPIRVCVIDDQLGARMASTKLIKLINPAYQPPANLGRIKATWEDELVKVAGADLRELQDCVDWVKKEPLRTVVFLDRMLEFPACVVDGLTLIPELTEHGALVLLRSGSDSDEDREMYTQQGAFGCIGKVLYGGHGTMVIEQAKKHIRLRLAKQLELSASRCAGNEEGFALCGETNGSQMRSELFDQLSEMSCSEVEDPMEVKCEAVRLGLEQAQKAATADNQGEYAVELERSSNSMVGLSMEHTSLDMQL